MGSERDPPMDGRSAGGRGYRSQRLRDVPVRSQVPLRLGAQGGPRVPNLKGAFDMPMNRKLLGAAAFSLALAGGGAAGAMLGTPSLTLAQDAQDAEDEGAPEAA